VLQNRERREKELLYQKPEYVNFSVNNADGNSGPKKKGQKNKIFSQNYLLLFSISIFKPDILLFHGETFCDCSISDKN